MIVYANDGYGFEREFCGCACVDVDSRLRAERVRDFRQGIQIAKQCQCRLGWNPRKPKTPLAKCLFRRVSSRLRGGSDLGLFIAIGTPLDIMGVDCWFESEHRIVTIDLTVRHFKNRSRADFVITREHFLRDQHYRIGDEIAWRLSPPRRR